MYLQKVSRECSNCSKSDSLIYFKLLTLPLTETQYYHENPDPLCPQDPVAGLPWCPVIWGDYILKIQATISTISRVVGPIEWKT